MPLTISVTRENDLPALVPEWQRLVDKSCIDPLFNSPSWLLLWWQNYGRALDAQLCVLAVRDGPELVGVVPLYRHLGRLRGGMRVTRIEWLGSSYRDSRGPLSEYLDAPVLPQYAQTVADLVSSWFFAQRDWRDFCANLAHGSGWLVTELIPRMAKEGQLYTRRVELLTPWTINLLDGVEGFRRGLSSSMRRKVFGLRRRIAGLEVQPLPASDMPKVFETLNKFHRIRWQRAHFVHSRRRFHLAFAAAHPKSVRLSLLTSEGQPISAMYDLVWRGREYNLQSGFLPSAAGPSVSVGYIHLGFALEAAAKEGLSTYDLLGGRGKNRDYKHDLARPGEAQLTLQAIRGDVYSRLYRSWDYLRAKRMEASSRHSGSRESRPDPGAQDIE